MKMMTREEVLEKIKDSKGEWKPQDNLSFSAKGADKDGFIVTVDLGDDEEVGFWCMSHHKDIMGAVVHGGRSNQFEDAIVTAQAAQIVAAFFDVKLDGDLTTTVTVEKVVEKEADRTNEHKLTGMVEAYEKIFGREITIMP